MRLRRIISGGQTGADQGGWLAAVDAGLATGGWMPLGYLTEAGPRPDFAALYAAREHASDKYPPRTYANAREADATVWFGRGDSRGFACTEKAALSAGKPLWAIQFGGIELPPEAFADLIGRRGVEVLNVAGNRESLAPGIRDRVRAYLGEVIAELRARTAAATD